MSLYDALSKISQQVCEQRHLMTTEAATKLVSINPFIRSLGYNITNLTEVQPEYSADAKATGGDKVDYAIMRNGKPIILIEAKTANIDLNENHWKQLHHYFVALDAEFGILTNGIAYQFYTDQNKQHVMDKAPFLTLDMLKLDAQIVNVLEGFSKTRFDPQRTVRKLKIFSLVEKEYKQPSDEFVKYFAKQIHSGALYQKHIKEFAPIVRQAWWDLVDKEIASRLQRHEAIEEDPAELPPETKIQKPTPPVASDDSKCIPIYGYYDEHKFEAELRLDSVRKGIFISSKAVRYNGEFMTSGDATWHAIRSVNSSFDSEDWDKEKINSWEFWHVVDPLDGSERILRLVAGRKQNRDEALFQRILSS